MTNSDSDSFPLQIPSEYHDVLYVAFVVSLRMIRYMKGKDLETSAVEYQFLVDVSYMMCQVFVSDVITRSESYRGT